uniref:DNA mismatch repair proteins mutS family domain-containing protein n=1 Tax=Romanomermis culicivorax TaxID=13658 RepID=A0A915IDE4_ROMCU
MHTIDSVLDGMSTFAVDVRQVSVSFAEATRKSLVIIDEFGKGTLTEVGLALLQSCLESWLAKCSDCPHLFVSTHFYSLLWTLKEHPLLKYKWSSLVHQTMETVRRGMEFIFLYQLVDGFIDCAYATQVASEAGLPHKIISRSYEVYNRYKNGERILRPDQTDENYANEFEKNNNLVNDFLLSIDESEFYDNFVGKSTNGDQHDISRDTSSNTVKVDV